MRALLPFAAMLPLLGCAATPPAPQARLPFDAVEGAGDPTRAAILNTAYAFGTPARLSGQPFAAARAAANFEYLAVEIPNGPRWREFSPLVGLQLAQGREELRAALGIAPAAPPQQVIDGLYAVSRAISIGDDAAAERILGGAAFGGGGPQTLQRLAALPALPKVNFAASSAAAELDRVGRIGDRGGAGLGGGRH